MPPTSLPTDAVLTLDKDGVKFVDLATGASSNARSLERTGNAIAASMDGQRFAVAHRPTKAEVEALPSVRNDKDAIKRGVKQGQIVVVYDMATLKPLYTLPELFDKVFRLEYSRDGKDPASMPNRTAAKVATRTPTRAM